MKTSILASTKVGYKIPTEEAEIFSGKEAGICYIPGKFEDLLSESEEKSLKRAKGTLKSGHHSVFGHVCYNFEFEEIPKILAMLLNNEKCYNTSEKSARYTLMTPSKAEEELYYKWIKIYQTVIQEKYPEIDVKQVIKLAQENARYLISVFTPATIMGYTTDLRQINYILGWAQNFIKEAEDSNFNSMLKPVLANFVEETNEAKIDGLKDARRSTFSLFATRNRKEEWGESYSINYEGTFAQLAQAQRHRTIKYEMSFLEKPKFFVPPIIEGTENEEEWLEDISSLSELFPQGMMIKINERGTPEDLIMKCKERLCGCAQLEIAQQTKATLSRYVEMVKYNNKDVYNYLLPYTTGARCTFKDYNCTHPCIWGAKHALDRLI